jgi:hypothetical protein
MIHTHTALVSAVVRINASVAAMPVWVLVRRRSTAARKTA